MEKIGNTDTYGINIVFDLTTYKVFITLNENYQIDFSTSGNFGDLLGFYKTKKLTSRSYGVIFLI